MKYRGTRRDDMLVGADTDDTFLPLRGHDTVDGGGGYDTLVVDYTDTIGRTAPSRISIADDMTLQGRLSGGDKDSVDFGAIEAVDYTGSSGDDTLSISSERPLYFGMLTLDGGAGYDRLEYTSLSSSEQTFFVAYDDHITWHATTTTGFEAFDFHLGGGKDRAYTADGDDVLYGEGGDDELSGGGGDDLLNGGEGYDVLVGADGADVFQFTSVKDFLPTDGKTDYIFDFSHADRDRIDVSAIDARPGVKGNQAFAFLGTGEFTGGGGGELRIAGFDDSNGKLYTIEGDVNHDGVADFSFRVQAYEAAPVAQDFIL